MSHLTKLHSAALAFQPLCLGLKKTNPILLGAAALRQEAHSVTDKSLRFQLLMSSMGGAEGIEWGAGFQQRLGAGHIVTRKLPEFATEGFRSKSRSPPSLLCTSRSIL